MAKSPFSSAGGGNADTSPFSLARARGGRCKAGGGAITTDGRATMTEARKGGNLGQIDGAVSKRTRGGKVSKTVIEKAEESSDPAIRKAAFKAEKKAGY